MVGVSTVSLQSNSSEPSSTDSFSEMYWMSFLTLSTRFANSRLLGLFNRVNHAILPCTRVVSYPPGSSSRVDPAVGFKTNVNFTVSLGGVLF